MVTPGRGRRAYAFSPGSLLDREYGEFVPWLEEHVDLDRNVAVVMSIFDDFTSDDVAKLHCREHDSGALSRSVFSYRGREDLLADLLHLMRSAEPELVFNHTLDFRALLERLRETLEAPYEAFLTKRSKAPWLHKTLMRRKLPQYDLAESPFVREFAPVVGISSGIAELYEFERPEA